MNYSNLRNFWYLVEKTNSSSLLNLSDMDLVNHLLRQLENQQLLYLEENDITSDYIYSKNHTNSRFGRFPSNRLCLNY